MNTCCKIIILPFSTWIKIEKEKIYAHLGCETSIISDTYNCNKNEMDLFKIILSSCFPLLLYSYLHQSLLVKYASNALSSPSCYFCW